jgi:hypothetical protein
MTTIPGGLPPGKYHLQDLFDPTGENNGKI